MLYVYSILILICIYIIFLIFKSFKKNEFNMFGYNLGKYSLSWLFKLYYPYKSYNEKVIPKEGPVIFVGNHKHIMDQCLVMLKTSRPIHYLAKMEYFIDPKTRWFFQGVGCIPVDREHHDDNAKEKALEVLNKGLALGIFPEGTRNKTDKLLLPFKYGAVSLAKKTNATLVPFAITGDYKFRTKNLKITFGTPFKVGSMNIEDANKKLYAIIYKMVSDNK